MTQEAECSVWVISPVEPVVNEAKQANLQSWTNHRWEQAKEVKKVELKKSIASQNLIDNKWTDIINWR